MADDVEVRIDGIPLVSAADWVKAQNAPESELPRVDPADYVTSRRFGLEPVDDARREYAWELARESMRRQGELLAERLKEFIANANVPGFHLRYIIWDGSRREWIVAPDASAVRPVGIAPDLVDRLTDPRRRGGTRQDYEELSGLFGIRGALA